MQFESKKVEDCFADAENYEYRIEATGAEFVPLLASQSENVRINDKLRRPTFTATLKNGTRLKGLLSKDVIKVGFTPEQAPEQKATFEHWLREL